MENASVPPRKEVLMRADPSSRIDPRDTAQLAAHPVSGRRIAALFRPHAGQIALVLALIVGSSLVGLATPFLTQRAINHALRHLDVPLLLILAPSLIRG